METIKKKRKSAKRFVIYKSLNPKFKIMADKYQYILTVDSQSCYFPILSLLLDELAERLFRKYSKKLEMIENLDRSIQKVYDLIDRVSKDFKEYKWKIN